MIARNTFTEDVSPGIRSFEWAAHGILAAVLILLPFAFGGAQNWSQEIFFVLTAVLVIAVLGRGFFDPIARISWSWAYLPILIFIVLTVFQLAPLSSNFLSMLSPQTTVLRQELLHDQPLAAAALDHQAISLYSLATEENLRLVLGVSGIFFVVTQVYRTAWQIEKLLLTIAAVGFAVSLLAVYQNISGTTMVYGIVPAGHHNSGPFMNHSHFSQFMNLSMGATLGAALLRWKTVVQQSDPHFQSFGDVSEFVAGPRMRLVLVLAAAIVVEAITVFLSMSRMGAISLMAAAAVIGLLLTWRTRSRDQGSVVLFIAIAILAALLCVGFDAVYDRLATLRNVDAAQGGRVEMLRDIMASFKKFPVFGTGLGSYEYVFPMFDHSPVGAIATHAENEFAQLLQESGIIGILIAVCFMATIGKSFWISIRKPTKPLHYVAFGIGFGLIAILIHSFSDFGQHAPANAVLTACCSALLVNIALSSSRRPAEAVDGPVASGGSVASGFKGRLQTVFQAVFCVVVLMAGYWCIAGSDAARLADNAWDDALAATVPLSSQQWQGSDDDYITLLTPATLATQLQPGNVKYRYLLNGFRWRSLLRRSAGNGKTWELKPATLQFVSLISADLVQAELLCPTYGPSYSLAGELEYFILKRPEGMAHVSTGYRLTPNDPRAAYIVGEFAVQESRWTDALAAFRTSALVGGNKGDAIALLVQQANKPDLAYQLAGGDGPSLHLLIDLLADRPQDQAIVVRCREDLISQLQRDADQPTAAADTIASLADQYATEGKKPEAISYFQKALALDYGRVDWHYRLATLLGETGNTADAMNEARICLRIRPQMKEATDLLGQLSVQSPTHSER